MVEPKSSLSLLFVIGIVENPIATEPEKNFLVTLPRHPHLILLFVTSSFLSESSDVR